MSIPNVPACYEKRRYGQAVLWLIHAILWTAIFALRIETEVTRMELRRGVFPSGGAIALYRADKPGKPLLRLNLANGLKPAVRQYAPVPIEEAA